MKNDEKQDARNQEDLYPWEDEKNARKSGVVRGAVLTGLISLSLIVGAGVYMYILFERQQERQAEELESQEQSYTELFRSRDSVINVWVSTFNQIEEDLDKITQREQMISTESAEDVEISEDRRQQILDDIQYINSMLDMNKKKIAALNSQLKKTGGSLQGLQAKIVNLEESIREKENEVKELKLALVDKDFEIGQLNDRMNNLQMTIIQKDEEISNQIDEMNKAYLASGTFDDLKEKGLVTKEGGFLGLLGRKEALVEDFSDTTFREIDLTEVKQIPVNSRKVKLITEHPTDSYELVREDEQMIASIEIKDPAEFWKISKYAVVEIGK
ncbi:MAG: hypothetical protein JW861_10925 [Bacteroidales bacterium]|nr:hypothetical protein [Bacteroidales bacterium]